MIKIAKYIAILSGKGGAGKTTTSVNLGMSLHKSKKNVVVVDTNLATPNVGLHLGLPPFKNTINSVLRGKATLEKVIHKHKSGLKVVPASLSIEDSANHLVTDFKDALAPLESSDLVLMDCAAGLWGNVVKATKAADEAIIVTNPELTALIDSLKAIKIAQKNNIPIRGVVVNKVTGAPFELKDETIESILTGYPIIAKIPFDKNVQRSISAREPVVTYRPNSPASRAFKKLAADLNGQEYTENFFDRFFDFFR